jgi:hypothetical protein
MLITGASLMTLLATTVVTFRKIKFLGHPLSFMMVRERIAKHSAMYSHIQYQKLV